MEQAVFSYAVSARLLCDGAWSAALQASSGGLVLGDPDTGVAADSLTSAAIEAVAVRDMFHPGARYLGRIPGGGPAPDGRGCAVELLSWLADTAPQAGTMLHAACHGAVVPGLGEDAPTSFLRLADGDTISAENLVRALVTGRSRALSMAVLAACSSAVPGRGHDEAFSVATAFLAGGAQTVVSALWRIPDGDTSVLMYLFHHFRQRLPALDALRAAQLWMLHPERREAVPMHDSVRTELGPDGARPRRRDGARCLGCLRPHGPMNRRRRRRRT